MYRQVLIISVSSTTAERSFFDNENNKNLQQINYDRETITCLT